MQGVIWSACIVGMCAAQLSAAQCALAQLAPPNRPPMRTPDFIQNPPSLQPELGHTGQGQGPTATPQLVGIAADGTAQPLNETIAEQWDSCIAACVEGDRTPTANEKYGTLVLVDGQRLKGTLSESQDGVYWTGTYGAPRKLQRDHVRTMTVQGAALDVLAGGAVAGARAGTGAGGDAVALINGGIVHGTVKELGGAQITILTKDGALTTESWDNVRAIAIGGKDAPALGQRVWLADGSIIQCANTRWTDEGTLEITVGGEATTDREVFTVPRADVRGFVREAAAVTALSALDMQAMPWQTEACYAALEPHAVGGDGPFGAATLELEGSASAAWSSSGERILSMKVALAPSVAHIGTVDVVIKPAAGPVQKVRLDPENARASVHQALPPGAFEIHLESADGSWVGDVVHLGRAVLINAKPA